MGRWGIIAGASPTDIPHLFVHFYLIYSMNKNYFAPGANYYDNHKEITINNPGANAVDLLRVALAEDVAPVKEDKPDMDTNYFPYLTKKCIEQQRVDAVEAEIQAARKGTAEDMWRTLWNNENMGYIEVEYIDATTLFRDIEKWYGKLPYKERNFREARNKR